MRDIPSRLRTLFSELRQRRIFHVLTAYAAVSFVVAQAAEIVVPALRLPEWSLTLIIVLAILGFPVAAILAWAFEVTPQGVRRAPVPTSEGGETTDAARFAPSRAALLVITLLSTAGAAWGAWAMWLRPDAGAETATDPVGAERRHAPTRIAVLYFDALGADEELRYFADGVTEDLIDRLAEVDELQVLSRTAVQPYRDAGATQDSIVRALGVGSLVEGSVRRSGGEVRVDVQLIDAEAGDRAESARLSGAWADRLELSDRIARTAADMIRRQLGIEVRLRQQRADTANLEAWTLVRQAERLHEEARDLFADGDPDAARRRMLVADSVLARAEVEDARWLEPVRLRGWLAVELARWGGPTPDAGDPALYWRAVEQADRALAARPGDPEALELRGTALRGLSLHRDTEDPEALGVRALRDLEAAVAADPSLARAWVELSEAYRHRSRLAEAKSAAERALEEDAFLSDAHVVVARLYQISLDRGDRDEAARWCEQGRERFPERRYFVACSLFNMALDGGPSPSIDLAWELYGEFVDRSPAARRETDRMTGGYFVAGAIARAALEAGATDSAARAVLADSARRVAERARAGAEAALKPWAAYYEANVRLLLGEEQAALRLIGEHLAALPQRRQRLASDWMFRPLWEDEGFRALVEER